MISTIEKVLFLKSVDLFKDIPGEDLARVAEIATEVPFEKDERIITEGEMGDCLYLVLEGSVRVLAGEQEVACLGEKQCFGEMAILDSEPRSASVDACEDVFLLKITQDDFYEMMAERSDIAQGIIKVLTGRLRQANGKVTELTNRMQKFDPMATLPAD